MPRCDFIFGGKLRLVKKLCIGPASFVGSKLTFSGAKVHRPRGYCFLTITSGLVVLSPEWLETVACGEDAIAKDRFERTLAKVRKTIALVECAKEVQHTVITWIPSRTVGATLLFFELIMMFF